MKTISKGKLLALFTLALVALFFYLYSGGTPRKTVEGSLGIRLPDSARNIDVDYHRTISGSTMTEMRTVMEMPLPDAQKLAAALGLNSVPSNITLQFGEPANPLNRWNELKTDRVAHGGTKWLKETPRLRPAYLGMIWADGEVYLYQAGLYGQTGDK